MQGTRLPDVHRDRPAGWENWRRRGPEGMETVAPPGAYMKILREDTEETWCWYVRSPDGDIATLGFKSHEVVEHPDGTITVSPSIVMPNNGWHGFLRAGVWSLA
jgi:hypothetical protein